MYTHDLDQLSYTVNDIRHKVESMTVEQLNVALSKLSLAISRGQGSLGDRRLFALMRRELSTKISTVRDLSVDIPCTLTLV